jgi:membrane-associated phospholipid phosphatase
MGFTYALQSRDKRAIWAVLVGCLVILFVTSWLAHTGHLVYGERPVLSAVNDLPDGLRSFFLLLTTSASDWLFALLLLGLLALRRGEVAWRLFASGFLTLGIAEILKQLIARPRPLGLMAGVIERQVAVTGFGFPSGHTALATAIGILLLPVIPRHWRWTVPVWIVLVALSRLYLGVHAPLDVLGGFAIGMLVSTVTIITVPYGVNDTSRPLAKKRRKA